MKLRAASEVELQDVQNVMVVQKRMVEGWES